MVDTVLIRRAKKQREAAAWEQIYCRPNPPSVDRTENEHENHLGRADRDFRKRSGNSERTVTSPLTILIIIF